MSLMAHLEKFSQFVVRNPSQFSPISTIRACFILLLFKLPFRRVFFFFFTEVNCIIEPEDSEKTFVQPLPLINFLLKSLNICFILKKSDDWILICFFSKVLFINFLLNFFTGELFLKQDLFFFENKPATRLRLSCHFSGVCHMRHSLGSIRSLILMTYLS